MTAKAACSSSVQPHCMVPRQSADTFKPVRPNLRYFIVILIKILVYILTHLRSYRQPHRSCHLLHRHRFHSEEGEERLWGDFHHNMGMGCTMVPFYACRHLVGVHHYHLSSAVWGISSSKPMTC